MKLIKKKLKTIIAEELNRALQESIPSGPPISDYRDDHDHNEYERGYQDGFDGLPIADDASLDYDAGYEDGQLDSDLPEEGGVTQYRDKYGELLR